MRAVSFSPTVGDADGASRVPVLIVNGFLGSGKTTLLNRLLSEETAGRAGALVNDFGAINIDAALAAAISDNVVMLTNGCVCCTINGDLKRGVERLLAMEPGVDRIVVETTGLADPLPVGLTFLCTDPRQRTTLESVITIVDCANFVLDLCTADAAMAQIVYGDVIVLNKTDLASPARVDEIEQRIAMIKPRARVLHSVQARVPLPAISMPLSWCETGLQCDAIALERKHLLADGFVAHAFRFDGLLSPSRFQRFLDREMPAVVFRAKGLVRFEGVGQRYVFQLCGSRAAFSPLPERVACAADTDNQFVFIGRGLERTTVLAGLEHCLTDGRRDGIAAA